MATTSVVTQPIGILDSGFGGLSVVRAIQSLMPAERLIFAADCAGAPWGDRSDTYIFDRVSLLVDFLRNQKIKALVLACNTATAVTVQALRNVLPFPVIGIEPAIFPAVRSTQTQVVGVIATQKTIESQKYLETKQAALTWAKAQGKEIRVISQGCPGLMECVEAGELDSEKTRALIRHYLDPMMADQVDQLVLGCTHYPFLAPTIQALYGNALHLIDPAPAVARELYRRLEQLGQLNVGVNASTSMVMEYYTTDANVRRQAVLKQLMCTASTLQELPIA